MYDGGSWGTGGQEGMIGHIQAQRVVGQIRGFQRGDQSSQIGEKRQGYVDQCSQEIVLIIRGQGQSGQEVGR